MDRPLALNSIPRDLVAICVLGCALGFSAYVCFFATATNSPTTAAATPAAAPAKTPRAPAELPPAPKGWVQPVALDFEKGSAAPIETDDVPQELPNQIRPVAMSVLRRLPATAEEPVAPLSEEDQLELEDRRPMGLLRLPPTDDLHASTSPNWTAPQPTPAAQPQSPLLAAPAPKPAKPAPRRTHITKLSSEQQAALAVVDAQARANFRHGCELAELGAYYSARDEFLRALRITAQAFDSAIGSNGHSVALASGLRAIREAEDFAPRGSTLEGDIDVAGIVAAHRTPILKNQSLDGVTPLAALQRYYTYAQKQIAASAGGLPAASEALFGLGRLQAVLVEGGTGGAPSLTAPRSLVYHQAALMVDSRNYLAANEMGVLLAKFGQYGDARKVLEHSVAIAPLPQAWHNLSVVHAHLGETQLAAHARAQYVALVGRSGAAAGPSDERVRWVDPGTFAATETGAAPKTAAAPPRERTPSTAAQPVLPGGEDWKPGVRR